MKLIFSKRYYFLFAILVLLGLPSTWIFISWKSTHIGSLEQFNNWLNNEHNRCISSRSITGVKISVKYQPPLYILLKDKTKENIRTTSGARSFDSLMKQQNKLLTFLMTMGPDMDMPEQRRSSSVMAEGVTGYSDYVQRVLSTNFFMEQYISLYVDGVKYKPALCVVENLYELSQQRSFMVVFVSEGTKNINDGKEYIFEYNDPFFGMGKVQFPFLSESLLNARNLKVTN